VRRDAAPYGANTAQVLGYLSPVSDEEVADSKDTSSPLLRSDMIGRSGLERSYDVYLRGKAGVTRYEVDKFGRVLGETEADPALAGANVVTSIDARVQALVEKELDQAMKDARKERDQITGRNYEADSGAVVVMESKTGRVVAMASNPEYDPNAWVGGISAAEYERLTGEDANYALLNRAIQGQSPPGSTFKVVTATGAVNAGYEFNGNHDCSTSYNLGSHTFKNFESRGYGPISIGRALEVSCNTVFYRFGHAEWQKDGGNSPKDNPNDWLYQAAHGYGLGSPTGIDLPNEVDGRIPDRQWKKDYWDANQSLWCSMAESDKKDYEHRLARENCEVGMKLHAYDAINFSIGQGDVLVTPIQMATIYGALANGGTLYEPRVGKAIIGADGKLIEEIEPQEAGPVPADNETIKNLREATEAVVTRGTASWRFLGWPQKEIPLHAKTGTSSTEGKQSTSWLATFSEDYTIVMTISQAGTGSGASGPAVRRMYEALYGVQEDGGIDRDKALLPEPEQGLPEVDENGTIIAQRDR
jgi:penicillin-binding protein 2